MATVRFTKHLRRFFPDLQAIEATDCASVRDALSAVEARWPGIGGYLVDDHGALRRHVNVFVDGEVIVDRERLSDHVTPGSVIDVMQALSGG